MTTFSTTVATTPTEAESTTCLAWPDEIRYILRVLIDDPVGDTYSDERLHDIILVSAHLISKEFIIDTEFVVDITAQSICPEPDTNFKNLTALKAAMIVLYAEAKTLASQAIKIVDGPSSLELGRNSEYIAKLADNAANIYAVARATVLAGQNIRMISTPFYAPNTSIGEVFS